MHLLKLIGSPIETYSRQLTQRLSLSFKPLFKAKKQWRALHWNLQVQHTKFSTAHSSTAQLMPTAIPLCKPLIMDFRTQMPGSKLSAWNLPCPPYPYRAQPCTGMCAPKSHWNPTGKRKPSRKRTSRNAQWPWKSQRLQNSLTMEFLSLCILLPQSLKLPHWGSTALSHKLCMFLFTYSNQLLRILWSKRKIIFF